MTTQWFWEDMAGIQIKGERGIYKRIEEDIRAGLEIRDKDFCPPPI